MGWLRIDDNVPHHLKFLKAGEAASWLWVCCLAYCQRQLTDGFIPIEAMSLLGAPSWKRTTPLLVAARLLEVVEGGYRVHDYLAHNLSRDVALAKRADLSAVRAEVGSKGGKQTQVNRSSKTSSNAPANDASKHQAHDSSPLPSPPIPSPPEEDGGSARARGPAPRTTGGVMTGSLGREHLRCVGPCGRVCLIDTQFAEFVRLRGGPREEAEAYVRTWKAGIDAAWNPDTGVHRTDPPGKKFEFWEARWLEDHPAAPSRTSTSTRAKDAADEAGRRFLAAHGVTEAP